MNRLLRSILFGSAAAISLLAGTAHAHDVEHARPPEYSARAPARVTPWDHHRDRVEMRREYRHLEAARERFYRRWHGDHHDRARFERWYAMRRAELGRRWAHHCGRG